MKRKGFVYILECSDGSYYTGSTNNLERRLNEHQNSQGANYTKNRLPVKLVYFEEFERVEDAFHREKQIQGWSRRKKKALIENRNWVLSIFSRNYTQFGKVNVPPVPSVSSTSSETINNLEKIIPKKKPK